MPQRRYAGSGEKRSEREPANHGDRRASTAYRRSTAICRQALSARADAGSLRGRLREIPEDARFEPIVAEAAEIARSFRAEAAAQRFVFEEAFDRDGERFGALIAHEQSGFAVDDRVAQAVHVVADATARRNAPPQKRRGPIPLAPTP